MLVEFDIAPIDPASFPRCDWSRRRWALVPGAGPKIIHRQPAGRGRPRKDVSVPTHRLIPIDRTKYPGEALRAIRATATNYLGEPRR